jgi:menaquinone-9 beta-reductase
VAAATRVGPIRGFPGLRGWLRRPWGPGWALVGDAGYFKDPTTAHGITDALRDAQLLATALDETLGGRAAPAEALGHYEQVRDQLSVPFFEITDRIASLDWTLDEVQRLHLGMSDIMQREVDTLADPDTAGAPLAAGGSTSRPARRPPTVTAVR